MIPVIHVVTVIGINDIDIVSFVPVVRPGFRPWVKHAEPIPIILKAGISFINFHGVAVDAETMILTKVAVIMVFRNTIAAITAALLPCAVISLPILCAMLLPNVLLFGLRNMLYWL